jgi:hypothetical protein
MKFTLEKLDTAFITRKVVEEEQKQDRFVTEVLLTPPEWMEFKLNTYDTLRYTYMYPPPGSMDEPCRLHIHRPLKAYNTSVFEVYKLVTNPIIVKLEPRK